MTHAVFVPARAKVLESGTVYSKTLQDYVTDSTCLFNGRWYLMIKNNWTYVIFP